MLYVTGAGQTSPISLDGTVSTGLPVQTALIPTAQIGGVPANVLYAGDCPGLISGVTQLNLLIPSGLTGNQPVTVQFGSAKTPSGVTLAVR